MRKGRIEAITGRSPFFIALIIFYILGFQIGYAVAKVPGPSKKGFKSLGSMMSTPLFSSASWDGANLSDSQILCIYSRKWVLSGGETPTAGVIG